MLGEIGTKNMEEINRAISLGELPLEKRRIAWITPSI